MTDPEHVTAVQIGDRLRISVALLRDLSDAPEQQSEIVRLHRIERATDGTLILYLDRAMPDPIS